MTGVVLAAHDDWEGFRRAIRGLIADGIAVDDVQWQIAGNGRTDNGDDQLPNDLFASAPVDDRDRSRPPAPRGARPLKLPADFVATARTALLHQSPARLPLMHRLIARIHRHRAIWLDVLDPDRVELMRLVRQVRREMHKMSAFVRFRPVHDESVPADSFGERLRHVAWFEPEHHIVHAMGSFFQKRFASMHWSILTPKGSLEWNGRELRRGPPARPEDAPQSDDGEALWLTYYRSIFNPNRLNLPMMTREMPRRYWRNLPEAQIIPVLAQDALARQQQMLAAPAADEALAARRRAIAEAARYCDGGDTRVAINPGSVSAGTVASGFATDATDPTITLARLKHEASRCLACPFAAHATQMVWGEGAPDARLMLVGEQPGDREDLEGRPFVGPAGRLLHDAIASLGWPRERLYLTNAVKHFNFEMPAGGALRGKRRIHKTAAQQEIARCMDWLEAEIATIRPRAIVALGRTAASALLGREIRMRDCSGEVFERNDGTPVLVIEHPSALLRATSGSGEEQLRNSPEFAGWVGKLDRVTHHL